jgi:hypothetical protein
LEYDDNYGLLIHSFIISFLPLIFIYLVWFYKAAWIEVNSKVLVLWLLLGSPLTFGIVAIYYQSIFGASLAT